MYNISKLLKPDGNALFFLNSAHVDVFHRAITACGLDAPGSTHLWLKKYNYRPDTLSKMVQAEPDKAATFVELPANGTCAWCLAACGPVPLHVTGAVAYRPSDVRTAGKPRLRGPPPGVYEQIVHVRRAGARNFWAPEALYYLGGLFCRPNPNPERLQPEDAVFRHSQKPLDLIKVLVLLYVRYAALLGAVADLVASWCRSTEKEGDVVADFFQGSGTTAAAAYLTKRRYVGGDIDPRSDQVVRKRLTSLVVRARERLSACSTNLPTRVQHDVARGTRERTPTFEAWMDVLGTRSPPCSSSAAAAEADGDGPAELVDDSDDESDSGDGAGHADAADTENIGASQAEAAPSSEAGPSSA